MPLLSVKGEPVSPLGEAQKIWGSAASAKMRWPGAAGHLGLRKWR